MAQGFGVSNGMTLLDEDEAGVAKKREREFRSRLRSCPAYSQVFRNGQIVHRRVLDILKKDGKRRVGVDHGHQLGLMALSMSSMLMDPPAMKAARKASNDHEWLEDQPCRIAWPLAIGAGKTLIAASTCRLAVDNIREDPTLRGIQSRGVLYTASSIDLLGNMVQALTSMGVRRDDIGVFHANKDSAVPTIEEDDVGNYPVLLVAQQRVTSISTGLDVEKKLGALVQFRGKDRLTIWDEAFRAALAVSCELAQLGFAVDVLRGRIDADPRGALADRNDSELLPRRDAKEFLSLLQGIYDQAAGGAASRAGKGASATKIDPFGLPPMSVAQMDMIGTAGGILHQLKMEGPGDALKALAQMVEAGGLEVCLLRGRADTVRTRALVRARMVIAKQLQRLVVLDAGYLTSMISRLDPTLKPGGGVSFATNTLQPKRFSNVRIVFHSGPSGRGSRSTSLDNDLVRERQITEQVRRIKDVPLGETSLVVTHKRRGQGTDFRGEIEKELSRVHPGWNDMVGETQRVSVIEWGQHVGMNCWRDCKHAFAIGVLRRSWYGDLRSDAFATAQDNRAVVEGLDPFMVEANQVAEAIMQLVGRLAARFTDNGEAEAAELHLYYLEGCGAFAGRAPCKGSPLWESLLEILPGVQICSDSEPPAVSGASTVADATEKVFAEVEGESISSLKLRPLVMALLPAGGEGISDKVFKAGLRLLQERNLAKAAAGQACWLKPTMDSRAWERHDPANKSPVLSTTEGTCRQASAAVEVSA